MPPLDARLQSRYVKLVEAHAGVSQALAAGIHGVPDAASAFAATQAAYRFFRNERVTLRALIEPLLETARHETPAACDAYLLVVHDWSPLSYRNHTAKADRVVMGVPHVPEGYELQTALLVGDRDGTPIAPAVLSLRAADGLHCSRSWRVRVPRTKLDELAPTMNYVERLVPGRPLVHLIDAEADSAAHDREWNAAGRRFLVRADDRLVDDGTTERRLSQIAARLRDEGAFRRSRAVDYQGRAAEQFVAEAAVTLTRPGQRNRVVAGRRRHDRRRVAGPPLSLRLIVAEVRDATGRTLATWYLLSNVPDDVEAATIALWYYWRWRIESFFKLLTSAGLEAESWQQESAAAVARRLLVAAMACAAVWRLVHSRHPRAEAARTLLVRLSGRQMKHGVKHTMPALLAGLWVLLSMLHAVEQYGLEEILDLAQLLRADPRPPP